MPILTKCALSTSPTIPPSHGPKQNDVARHDGPTSDATACATRVIASLAIE